MLDTQPQPWVKYHVGQKGLLSTSLKPRNRHMFTQSTRNTLFGAFTLISLHVILSFDAQFERHLIRSPDSDR